MEWVKEKKLSFLEKIIANICIDRLVNRSNRCEYDNGKLKLSKKYVKRKGPKSTKLDWYIIGECEICGNKRVTSEINTYAAPGIHV